jgi:hypothetical protein
LKERNKGKRKNKSPSAAIADGDGGGGGGGLAVVAGGSTGNENEEEEEGEKYFVSDLMPLTVSASSSSSLTNAAAAFPPAEEENAAAEEEEEDEAIMRQLMLPWRPIAATDDDGGMNIGTGTSGVGNSGDVARSASVSVSASASAVVGVTNSDVNHLLLLRCERAVLGRCLRFPGISLRTLCSPNEIAALPTPAIATLVHSLVKKGILVLTAGANTGANAGAGGRAGGGVVGSKSSSKAHRVCDLFSDDLGLETKAGDTRGSGGSSNNIDVQTALRLSLGELLTVLGCRRRRHPPQVQLQRGPAAAAAGSEFNVEGEDRGHTAASADEVFVCPTPSALTRLAAAAATKI